MIVPAFCNLNLVLTAFPARFEFSLIRPILFSFIFSSLVFKDHLRVDFHPKKDNLSQVLLPAIGAGTYLLRNVEMGEDFFFFFFLH